MRGLITHILHIKVISQPPIIRTWYISATLRVLITLYGAREIKSNAMKKTLLVFSCLIACFQLFAQNYDVDSIKLKYGIDCNFIIENNDLIFSKVIKTDGNLSKDEIFTKVQAFFAYNYNSAKHVIQVSDKEQGLIIGKGLYADLNEWVDSGFGIRYKLSTEHIAKVECKDGRIRAIVTINNGLYEEGNWMDFHKNHYSYTYKFTNNYPFVPMKKKKMTKNETHQNDTFIRLVERVNNTFSQIEEYVTNKSTSLDSEDW